jgi:hypothetical protein
VPSLNQTDPNGSRSSRYQPKRVEALARATVRSLRMGLIEGRSTWSMLLVRVRRGTGWGREASRSPSCCRSS